MSKMKILVVMLLIMAAGATYAWACQGPCTPGWEQACNYECCNSYFISATACYIAYDPAYGCVNNCICNGDSC